MFLTFGQTDVDRKKNPVIGYQNELQKLNPSPKHEVSSEARLSYGEIRPMKNSVSDVTK